MSLAVHQNGSLWGWGSNLPNASSPSSPQPIETPDDPTAFSNVRAVAAGADHALVLKESGAVWGFGFNDEGQLGSTPGGPLLQKLPLANMVQVACGEAHSLALGMDGSVWSWGRNTEGQLGVSDAPPQPQKIPNLAGVVQLAAGQFFSLALLENGQVWGWGENTHGQLGVGGFGQDVRQPQQVLGLTNIQQLAAGRDFALAVNASGQVLAWGNNRFGQLGNGSTTAQANPVRLALEQIQLVQTGLDHSLALGRNGTVLAWGSNQFGQIGNAGNVLQTTPSSLNLIARAIVASQHQSGAISGNGLLMWGQNRFGQIWLPTSAAYILPYHVFPNPRLP